MADRESRYESVRKNLEVADAGFFVLRVIALAGTVAWLLAAAPPRDTVSSFLRIAAFFLAYNVLLYALLVYRFDRKREIYRLSLLPDLAFVYLLVAHSGGFASGFFIGFYLLTVLHAFYYGYRTGIAVAVVCMAVYFLSGLRVSAFDPVDFLLRSSFLFLIAFPIGLLSVSLRRDKEQIESLNRELRQSLDATRRLQAKLLEAEKLSALGRLTADVAHEIRNPLTAIGGFAKRLEKRLPESTAEREYAGIVVSEVSRLERILRDTLTFSRETKYHLQHEDLNGLLARTAAKFGEACREKGLSIRTLPTDSLPSCIADGDQIRQAVDNLVTNAIDAMEAGGTLTLATRTACENGTRYVVVDVMDTGPGISPVLAERIFEPFYSTKEIGHGTGLGLSICKKIMEEHRGSIRLSEAPGGGSVFSLYLPYLLPEEAFKAQCWEVVRCGMETAGHNSDRCPAYPNYGRICWSVAGTLSEAKVDCRVAEKIGDCRKCAFYQLVQPSCPGETPFPLAGPPQGISPAI
jgi:signal transduction histidine kinase